MKFKQHALMLCQPLVMIAVLSSTGQATTPFAISATNVTISASGSGSSSYLVSGIPITGNLIINCQYSGAMTQAKIPTCGQGPLNAVPVTAGETVKGAVEFYPAGTVAPLAEVRPSGLTPIVSLGFLFAVPLLLGLRSGPRRRRWNSMIVVGVIAIAGVSSCGANMNAMTPGTYRFTITAGNGGTNNNLMAGATTTINVTVP